MSKITGQEPEHWHNADGTHRMRDPRRFTLPQPIPGTREMAPGQTRVNICYGDPDLARYWDHLDEHDRLMASPERKTDDSPAMSALLDALENSQRITRTTGELINKLREDKNDE